MGGRGARSASSLTIVNRSVTYAPPAGRIGDRQVGDILDEAVEAGAILYEKPRTSKDMARDLFAHAALYLDGRRFTVLAERTSDQDGKKGGTNVDLLMHDGVYWEVKSPISDGRGKDPLRFVQRRMEEAEHDFQDDPRTKREHTRLVLNSAYTSVPDSAIRERLVAELDGHPNIKEVLFVKKDGSLESFIQKRSP